VKDIRVDSEGEFRCWNCGNKGLLEKRTFRAKMLVGVGALLTKKKLKCQTCGEYNDTGNAKPYEGPESRKWRKVWEKSQEAKGAAVVAAENRAAQANAREIAQALMTAASQGRQPQPTPELSSPLDGVDVSTTPAPPQAPAWQPDPTGRHEARFWDGYRWTEHISDRGVQGTDGL
jgi:type II secretory pathway pseudopilin PulG